MELLEFTELYLPAAERNLSSYSIYPACVCEETVKRLFGIVDILMQNARKFNLTAILEPTDIIKKHLIDSILPLAELCSRGYFNPSAVGHYSAADVGTGAGFPCLPMAAVCLEYFPGVDLRFTAIDATAKKIEHVRQVSDCVGLSNVDTLVGRAEEIGKYCQGSVKAGAGGRRKNDKKSTSVSSLRESFDLTCARAVSPLPILLELLSPLTKAGGIIAALKSHAGEEIAAAGDAPSKLGLELEEVIGYSLDGEDHRELLVYGKIRQAELKYPRQYNEIVKRPLK